MNNDAEKLLTFPCQFSIKIMGLNNEQFEKITYSIISKHVEKLKEDAVRTRPSSNNKYLSLTISIQAESQQQLDTIYQELTACEQVLMAL